MRHNALGLVEVRGYLGAIAAADAALKAASVTCIGAEIVKGGLVTVKLSGDVGAVQSAVEAGAEAAKQLNVLLTRHVIARLHEETAAMVAGPEDAGANEPQAAAEKAAPAEGEAPAAGQAAPAAAAEEATEASPVAEAVATEAAAETEASAAGESAEASKAETAVLPDSGRTGNVSAAKPGAPEPAADRKTAPSAQPSRTDAHTPRKETAAAPAAKRAKKSKKATS
ncbi:MAG: BMC domain-containing protein [Paenibacillus dendritiformis]|uniref:BMC domain-containing protein n=1 Tax=uncultured Paenibacillus sp. TaxID=227322 RepID=UPI0025E8623F|nr:BMC domain-containing protein [uncultured Paenibacillus sp.]MDU5142503.1 BMC domain-containing protein [Paenibacillus dendritiformis]